MQITKTIIQQLIIQKKQEREEFVVQVNLRLAEMTGGINALEQLLSPAKEVEEETKEEPEEKTQAPSKENNQ